MRMAGFTRAGFRRPSCVDRSTRSAPSPASNGGPFRVPLARCIKVEENPPQPPKANPLPAPSSGWPVNSPWANVRPGPQSGSPQGSFRGSSLSPSSWTPRKPIRPKTPTSGRPARSRGPRIDGHPIRPPADHDIRVRRAEDVGHGDIECHLVSALRLPGSFASKAPRGRNDTVVWTAPAPVIPSSSISSRWNR